MRDEFVRPGDFAHLSVVTGVSRLVSVSVCGLYVLSDVKALLSAASHTVSPLNKLTWS